MMISRFLPVPTTAAMTEREARFADAIGAGCSIRELCKRMNISSVQAAVSQAKVLARKGLIAIA